MVPIFRGLGWFKVGLILYLHMRSLKKPTCGRFRASVIGVTFAARLFEFIENVSVACWVMLWCTYCTSKGRTVRTDEMEIIYRDERKKGACSGYYPRRMQNIPILHCCGGCAVLSRPLLTLLKAPLSNYPLIAAQTFVKTCCHSYRDSISTGN